MKIVSRLVLSLTALSGAARGLAADAVAENSQDEIVLSCQVLVRKTAQEAARRNLSAVAVLRATYRNLREDVTDKARIEKFDAFFALLDAQNPGAIPKFYLFNQSVSGQLVVSSSGQGSGFVNMPMKDFLRETNFERELRQRLDSSALLQQDSPLRFEIGERTRFQLPKQFSIEGIRPPSAPK